MLRSSGLDPFEARIRVSGLFDDSGDVDAAGNKIWVHKATQVRMLTVVPQGEVPVPSEHAFMTGNEPCLKLGSVEPFLIAEVSVGVAEWARIAEVEPTTPGPTALPTWNHAEAWCARAKLRLPTYCMWALTQTAALSQPFYNNPCHLQDVYQFLVEALARDSAPPCLRNPFVAVGDEDYSSDLWVSGSPADLVFEGFLMAGNLEHDYLEVEERISAFGLNVGVDPPSVTWYDRTGRPRQIVARADPFPEAGRSLSDATTPTSREEGPGLLSWEERTRISCFDGMSAAQILDSDEFSLSGADVDLPLTSSYDSGLPRAEIRLWEGRPILHVSPYSVYSDGRNSFRPVWR
jgi:hypothetical protein